MESIKKDIYLLKNIKKYFKNSIGKIIILEALLIIDIVVQTLHPLIWGKIVVCLFEGDKVNFIIYTIAVIVIVLLRTSIEFINGYLNQKFNQSIKIELKTDIYNKVLELPYKNISKYSNGELYSRLESDSSAIAGSLINIVTDVSTNFLKLIIVGIVMIRMNIYLACIILMGTPIIAIVIFKYGKFIRALNEKNLKIHDKYYSFVQQIIVGMSEIKVMRISKNIIQRYKNKINDAYNADMKMAVLNGSLSVIGNIFNLIMDVAILVIGGWMILNRALEYEYFIAFNSYQKQFSEAYMSILHTNTRIQTVLTSIERLFELLKNEEKELHDVPESGKFLSGYIEFENICFSYDGKNDVLKNVSFSIIPNSITGIIGKNGCGKTTIIKLMLKLYNCDIGNICIDGINLRNISDELLSENIFPSMQNAFLFNTSIKDNFLLINPDATLQEIISACKQSGIHEYIDSLKDKYNTLIGENGAELSGGQRQRLILARSILKNSNILIFDEITSSIDQESTKNIKEVLKVLSKNHTVIIISHDNDMYDLFDQTIYVDNGEILNIQSKENAV